MKLIGEFFWTDRWIGSSAWLLPIDARGLYREMLTQAWRRGAQLPADDEQIKRACGVTDAEWDRCWPQIARYWRVDGARLVNDTQREVYEAVMRKQDRLAERSAKANIARWGK